ncbi:hypothetical protein LIER_08909 [Lithospermum erythrorhizon]|uniref:Protein kinase domain-containing protein n=1 Tax=Lithospermum erythrorhizon TaxID=34254 RepID=A0AAV3PF14_LITER
MAGKVVDKEQMPFDFEFVESDSDQLTAVPASQEKNFDDQNGPWIDPKKVNLRHRIGVGLFGDLWLATHHYTTKGFEEYREVAVKMLHRIKDDDSDLVLNRLHDLISKCRELQNVCCLHGICIINEKLCILTKFYDGSVGKTMTRLVGGRGNISLHDVLRYGIDLAQGIIDLHSKGILVLNIKPSNILLNENDQAIVGDPGIPYLLLGISLLGKALRLGSPNYMAPEQWQPEIGGPISFETDSWGFGCSIVEMLTGNRPWSGKSVDEIYKSVVKKLEKPLIPSGLPPALENVIIGCFEYDPRSRPLMRDILDALKSCQDAVSRDEDWESLGSKMVTVGSGGSGYSKWLLMKDHLRIGDIVRSRKPPNSFKSGNMDVPEGTVVGVETDQSGFVLVRVHGIHGPVRVHSLTLERVTFGLAAGDWVRLQKEDKKQSPVGILHSIDRNGSVSVGFIGAETLWNGNYSDLQMANSYHIGQFVTLKGEVFSPRFEWPRKAGGEWATGKIFQVLPNGCLNVDFPSKPNFFVDNTRFLADPTEVEVVSFNTCPTIIKKYQHLEDFHWAVRPLLIALSLFTAMKLGALVGKKFGRGSKPMVTDALTQSDGHNVNHKKGVVFKLPL